MRHLQLMYLSVRLGGHQISLGPRGYSGHFCRLGLYFALGTSQSQMKVEALLLVFKM